MASLIIKQQEAFCQALIATKQAMSQSGQLGTFNLWTSNLVLADVDDDKVLVWAADAFMADFISSKGYDNALAESINQGDLAGRELIVNSPETEEDYQVKQKNQGVVFKRMQRLIKRRASLPQQQNLPFPVPTQLCRTTFFRPFFQSALKGTLKQISDPKTPKKEIIKKYYIEERHETRWATLDYLGLECGIKEEDVLLLLLQRFVASGRKAYTISEDEILAYMGVSRTKSRGKKSLRYTGRQQNIVKEAMIRLSSIEFFFYLPTDNQNEIEQRFKIFNGYLHESDTKRYDIDFSAYFLNNIRMGLVTGVSPEQRILLGKKTGAIATHRFLATHSGLTGHHRWAQICETQRLEHILQKSPIDRRKEYKSILEKLIESGYLAQSSYTDDHEVLHWTKRVGDFSGGKLIEALSKIEELA